jgi:cytochrome c556
MRFGRSFTIGILSVAFAGAALAAEPVIKYRQSTMKAIGGHMQSIAAIVKGEVPYTDQLVVHARALADTAAFVRPVFEEKATSKDSTAKAEIWQRWDDFATKADAMKAAADKLAATAAAGNQGATRGAVGELGKACKSCHDSFREKR